MMILGDKTLAYAVVNICLRLVIWVLPVFLYLKYVDQIDPTEYLKLRRQWRKGIWIGLFLSGINGIISILRFGIPHLNMQDVSWNSILSTSLLIGFIEEVPFRGFIFQKIQERYGFPIGVLLSSLLFVGIHLSGWILLHTFSMVLVLSIFLFGVVMAVLLTASHSLWSTIVVHSLNDFLAVVVFHR
jgi:membrane protease YdiL (CAAX protease family)